jgi:hypothetical protein
MPKYTGQNLAVKWGATVLTANLVKGASMPEKIDVYESSGAGDVDKTYLSGKKDKTISLDLWDDTVPATIFALFPLGSEQVLIVYPQGATSGKPRRTVTAIVTSRDPGYAHDGVVPLAVEMQGNSAIVEDTVP